MVRTRLVQSARSAILLRAMGKICDALCMFSKVSEPLGGRLESTPFATGLIRETEEMADLVALAFEAGGLGIWYYDPAKALVGGDVRMAELFGMSEIEAPAEAWIAKIHPDDQRRVAAEFAAALAGKLYDTEYRIHHAGKTRWIRAKAQWGLRKQQKLVGICEDVTASREADAALKDVQESLRLASSTGRIASWDWNLETGRTVWTHSEWAFGRSPEEVDTADKCFSFIHPEDVPIASAAVEPALQAPGEYRSEFRTIWPDGSIHWNLGRGQSLAPNADGKPSRMIGVNLDITERKQVEIALRQTEKLAAVGRLASSMAHELNNPLEAVTNLLYLAQTYAIAPETKNYLAEAERELRRMSAITHQTLRFHKQASNASACSCVDLISNAISMYEARFVNSRVAVYKRKRAEKLVTCYASEISQVIGNVVSNAIDAMHGNGGSLFLRSREGTDWRTGRRGLVITIADTGSGMSAETRGHLFEAFYTTKGIGGTGLGLWVSKGIIENHKGRLLIRSNQDREHHGTVVTVFLPFGAV